MAKRLVVRNDMGRNGWRVNKSANWFGAKRHEFLQDSNFWPIKSVCCVWFCKFVTFSKIVSEYDQEIPQSQTAHNPVAPREEPLNHHETPGRQIKQSNQLSLPHQDDCNTRMDIK